MTEAKTLPGSPARSSRKPRESLPHVLLVPSSYPSALSPVSGVFYRDQARALHAAGLRVGIIAPELRRVTSLKAAPFWATRFQITAEDDGGIQTYRSHDWNPPKLRKATRWLWIHEAHRLMRRYLAEQGRPDILHAHGALWGGFAARRLSQTHGIPFVVTEHSTDVARGRIREWQRPHLDEVYGEASCVIAVSNALAGAISPLTRIRKIEVIPNLVDTGFFTPPPVPQREVDGFRFAVIALLSPKKGIHLLLEAFAAAFQGQAGIHLDIGGDGEERSKLEALAARLGLRDQVRFLGLLDRERVRELLWRADAFVLPSHIETFGVVLIEAMAAGIPVIATRCGGPEDFVSPPAGTLVSPGNVEELAEAMKRAAGKGRTSADEAAQIRAYAAGSFSAAVVSSRLQSLYERVLEQT